MYVEAGLGVGPVSEYGNEVCLNVIRGLVDFKHLVATRDGRTSEVSNQCFLEVVLALRIRVSRWAIGVANLRIRQAGRIPEEVGIVAEHADINVAVLPAQSGSSNGTKSGQVYLLLT